MCTSQLLTTIADEGGEISVKSAKLILRDLNTANLALRRIQFLASYYDGDNIHLQEIAEISGNVLKGEPDR